MLANGGREVWDGEQHMNFICVLRGRVWKSHFLSMIFQELVGVIFLAIFLCGSKGDLALREMFRGVSFFLYQDGRVGGFLIFLVCVQDLKCHRGTIMTHDS